MQEKNDFFYIYEETCGINMYSKPSGLSLAFAGIPFAVCNRSISLLKLQISSSDFLKQLRSRNALEIELLILL